MAVVVECCGRRYTLGERAGTRRVKCLVCGKVVAVDVEASETPRVKAASAPAGSNPDESSGNGAAASGLTQRSQQSNDAPALRKVTPIELTLEDEIQSENETLELAPSSHSSVSRAPIAPRRAEEGYAGAVLHDRSRLGVTWNWPMGSGSKSAPTASDTAAPFLIALYLILTILTTVQEGKVLAYSGVFGRSTGFSPAIPWIAAAIEVGLFFLLVVPMVLGAVYLSCKFLEVELPPRSYLRACGLAVVPPIVIVCFRFYPASSFLPFAIGFLILFVDYYLIYRSFGLDPVAATVTLSVCSIFYLGAQFMAKSLLVGVLLNWLLLVETRPVAEEFLSPGVRYTATESVAASIAPPSSAPQAAADDPALSRFENHMTEISDPESGSAREELLPKLQNLRAEEKALSRKYAGRPEWAKLEPRYREVERRVMQLPSRKPDASIFEPIPPGAKWEPLAGDAALLADPVRFASFSIRPPRFLAASRQNFSNGGEGISWGEPASGRLILFKFTRRDQNQQRPWLIEAVKARAVPEAASYYQLNMQSATETFGVLNGIPVSRIEGKAFPSTGDDEATDVNVRYVFPDGNFWITITLQSSSTSPDTTAALEAALRSFRRDASPAN